MVEGERRQFRTFRRSSANHDRGHVGRARAGGAKVNNTSSGAFRERLAITARELIASRPRKGPTVRHVPNVRAGLVHDCKEGNDHVQIAALHAVAHAWVLTHRAEIGSDEPELEAYRSTN